MNRKRHPSSRSETAAQYDSILPSGSNGNAEKGGKETLRVALRKTHSRPYASLLNIVVNQASFDYDYTYYDPICWGIRQY